VNKPTTVVHPYIHKIRKMTSDMDDRQFANLASYRCLFAIANTSIGAWLYAALERLVTRPEATMQTDIRTMRSADWDALERDIVSRIRLLRGMVEHLKPNELHDKVANELILSNVRLLAEFCANVTVEASK